MIFTFKLSAQADSNDGPKGPYIIRTGSKFNNAYTEDFELINSNIRKYEKTLSLCKKTEYFLISDKTPKDKLPKNFDLIKASTLTSEVLMELSKSNDELNRFENLCQAYLNFKIIGKYQRPECLSVIEASQCVKKLNLKVNAGMIINRFKTAEPYNPYPNFKTHQYTEFEAIFIDLKTINSSGQNYSNQKKSTKRDKTLN